MVRVFKDIDTHQKRRNYDTEIKKICMTKSIS